MKNPVSWNEMNIFLSMDLADSQAHSSIILTWIYLFNRKNKFWKQQFTLFKIIESNVGRNLFKKEKLYSYCNTA